MSNVCFFEQKKKEKVDISRKEKTTGAAAATASQTLSMADWITNSVSARDRLPNDDDEDEADDTVNRVETFLLLTFGLFQRKVMQEKKVWKGWAALRDKNGAKLATVIGGGGGGNETTA